MNDISSAIKAEPEPDAPICPRCGYLLIGLTSERCPECGYALGHDLSIHRPSRGPTPWSDNNPRPLILGVAPVLRHPIATLEQCGLPERVSARRAALFAGVCTFITVLLWPLIREGGMFTSIYLAGAPDLGRGWASDLIRQIDPVRLWRNVGTWEAWSITRWWLLFFAIALTFPRNKATILAQNLRSAVLVRLLLFAPWIAVLELLYLIGVWFAMPLVFPEPGTLFGMQPVSLWLIRGAAPTFLIGLIFFRAVMQYRWHWALLCAALLVPVALPFSVLWTQLFIGLRII